MNYANAISLFLLCSLMPSGAATAQPHLELLNNSPSLSQIIDINNAGHAIGVKDVEVPKIGFAEQSFYWDGERELAMPMLERFTNVQVAAIADNNLVVGYASRSFDDSRGGIEACAWDPIANKIIGLGRLEGHRGSQAFDVSDDGNIVVGYSTGKDPQMMVPVVWQRTDGKWTCQRLPTVHDFNPYMLTSRVVVSGDGTKIATCITVEVVDRPVAKHYKSSTFLWQRDEEGNWDHEKLTDHQLRMGDINNDGALTGSGLVDRDRRAFVISADREFQLLEPLDGDANAGGTDINNKGVVVGYSDDPYGPKGGPTAFVWDGDKARALQIPGNPYFSWAATINDKGTIAGYLTPRPKEENADREEATDEVAEQEAMEQTVSFVLGPE